MLYNIRLLVVLKLVTLDVIWLAPVLAPKLL